jgi:hypothetical protein
MPGAGLLMVMDKSLVAFAPELSVAVTVKFAVPAVLGVPRMVPELPRE